MCVIVLHSSSLFYSGSEPASHIEMVEGCCRVYDFILPFKQFLKFVSNWFGKTCILLLVLFVICILDFGCKDVPSFCLMSIHGPGIHGQSINSLQGALGLDLGKSPATHDFILCCCWWKEPIAALYFLCLLLFASRALCIPGRACFSIKSMKQNHQKYEAKHVISLWSFTVWSVFMSGSWQSDSNKTWL